MDIGVVKDVTKIAILMILIDSVYLHFIKDSYGRMVANIQKSPMKIRMIGAVLSYCTVVGGFYLFGYRENLSYLKTFFLGIMMYGIYETTSYALFDNWEVWALVVDTIWGGLLYLLTKIILDRFF